MAFAVTPSHSNVNISGIPPTINFEATRWTQVLHARSADDAQRRKALEYLCQVYWYPLYAFLRRSGREVEDAQDLTQAFFEKLLDGRLLAGADPGKGKFRTLLLQTVKNLDADAYKMAGAQKRGGKFQFISLDAAQAEERWQAEQPRQASPEVTFDQAWAVAVMDRAGRRLRQEYEGPDRRALFEALLPRLTGSGGEAAAAAGLRLGMSEGAVKMALSRLRRRYADILREEVAETVGSRGEVEDELRYLLTAFA